MDASVAGSAVTSARMKKRFSRMRVSKDALSNLEQSSGEAPMKKLRLVEDQVMAEEEMVADPPLATQAQTKAPI